ncbi:helix-turn-helix domain-containing protein [Streptomyces sp. KR80]|uniref:helix-turn-helix domain-containing protein n=1 Tax=Streptomyces sp. KR80 TaxID=3457426 RepID=UPI003FD2FF01
MGEIDSDLGRSGPTATGELMRALRTGPFELAMKLALRDSGLSLERIQHRLARRGLRISASTLSNWQTGRSRPERPDSIRALHVLEQLLELPRDSLLRLVGPRRPRGRWTAHVPGSVRYDALFDDHARLTAILADVTQADDRRYLAVSAQDRVTLDADGRFRLIVVQQVITALVDGVESCSVFFHAEDGPVPEIVAMPVGCRIGRRRTDPAAGIAVAEALLDCRLDRGDVFLLEYGFRFTDAVGDPADYYYRAFRKPCRQYLLRVEFDPAALPVRCFGFRATRIGAPFADSGPLACQRGRPAHLLAADIPPGIVGIRWEWR